MITLRICTRLLRSRLQGLRAPSPCFLDRSLLRCVPQFFLIDLFITSRNIVCDSPPFTGPSPFKAKRGEVTGARLSDPRCRLSFPSLRDGGRVEVRSGALLS